MASSNIIGRKAEIESLTRLLKTGKSEFIALYGRRRVGKSFLVNELYKKRIVFTAVGTYVKDGDKEYETYRQLQLNHFYDALILAGLSREHPHPTCWREAFLLLRILLTGIHRHKKVVFFDELPWLAGPQSSEMIAELGYFWNSWANNQRDIILVVCGSATSWMLDNIIRDYGGLHGRLTAKMKLQPFTLAETEEFFKKRGFHLSRYEIALAYMSLGGIPYYLEKLQNGLSLTDNIDHLFFADSDIHQEFKDVYAGLYSSKERYVDIVKALGRQFYGMTQRNLADATGMKSGGTFSELLDNLYESGIIRKYPRYGKERVETIYQLTDFFSLFYLRFIDGVQCQAGMWLSINRTGKFYNWAGETFELLCIAHSSQLQKALRVYTIDRCYCWSGQNADGKGAQIDLVLESNSARTDYLCEMKFAECTYSVTAEVETNFRNKIDIFSTAKQHRATHSIQTVMVTTFGIAQGVHTGIVNHSVTLDALFTPPI